jgi:hypothetical protein
MKNTADVKCNPITVLLQSISGVIAIKHLFAFYDIHRGKREVLLFYFVPDTTRYMAYIACYIYINLPLELLYPLRKPQQNLLGSFKDLIIHRDRQREATLFFTMFIIIISLLMSPLLGHRPYLWITHK